MSTLKFTLPLSLSLYPRHRHARKGPRPSTPADQDAAATEGVEGAALDRPFAGSHDKPSHILRRLKKSIRRGFISEIDMALSFSLDVSRDDGDAPQDPLIEAAPPPLDVTAEPIVKSQVCSACEAANEPAAKFCNQCGTAFTPPAEPTPPTEP
jgi:ribosomal protein L40E